MSTSSGISAASALERSIVASYSRNAENDLSVKLKVGSMRLVKETCTVTVKRFWAASSSLCTEVGETT